MSVLAKRCFPRGVGHAGFQKARFVDQASGTHYFKGFKKEGGCLGKKPVKAKREGGGGTPLKIPLFNVAPSYDAMIYKCK